MNYFELLINSQRIDPNNPEGTFSMHQSHLQGDLSDAPHREIPFSSDKTKVKYY